ncbi:MAG: hypothetical protein VB068_08785 [Petrimonas sp.]|nr:hypothetical protein [Petrimonas sp.]
MMALGTGFVIGYMTSPVIMVPLKIPEDARLEVIFPIMLCFIFSSQIIMLLYFWGKRRGEFEYSFLENYALKKRPNPELSARLKEVKRELKFGGVSLVHDKLIAAAKEFPENFVVHFMFALSCERMGLAEVAIEAYETSRKLIPEPSQALITYVEKQISRVKLEGPTRMSTAPGLQYLMW